MCPYFKFVVKFWTRILNSSPIYFIFMQLLENFGQIIGWHPPGIGAPLRILDPSLVGILLFRRFFPKCFMPFYMYIYLNTLQTFHQKLAHLVAN